MSKKFQLVQTCDRTQLPHNAKTDWSLCIICQDKTAEALTCPALSKRKDCGKGYTTLAQNLEKFNELGKLPRTLHLDRLDDGDGVEATMVAHQAKWHHKCMLRYNTTKLKIAEKRQSTTSTDDEATGKRTRSCTPSIETDQKRCCFFCGEIGEDTLHESATFQIDERVRMCAEQVGDSELQAKLSRGDMVAQDAKYHRRCLLDLYYRAKVAKKGTDLEAERDSMISSIALAELVLHIEECHLEDETAPVFRLADLVSLYKSRMEVYGVALDYRVNSTRLKERLMSRIPSLRAQNRGRDILLAFDEDFGEALNKACQQDSDSDAIHLARAAQIVRRDMFNNAHPFSGHFTEDCQKSSVPNTLLALVSMVMEGSDFHNSSSSRQAALSISQVLKFNSVKHQRKSRKDEDCTSSQSVRHSTTQETPLPIYVGLMLHAETRKRGLVDKLFRLGLSISYDRVLRLSAQMGNSVCQLYQMEQVVCPPTLRGKVFTTAAVDNIDHNPSATTAKDSFHGTGISLLQHPSVQDDGTDRSIASTVDHTSSKGVDNLPNYYTEVAPVDSSIKGSSIPDTSLTSIKSKNFEMYEEQEYKWLENTMKIVEDVSESATVSDRVSWAAYHASQQDSEIPPTITPTALLPLFQESAHTVAMIRHSMNVVMSAVTHLNPGQTPVITFDQPLFALAKQIQWKWPNQYGDDKLVVMFGGLHIEMAALKTLGNWLDGSGWVQALVQAEIATAGTADSFLRAAHVTRTRRAHQITAATLYILQRRAYDNYCRMNDDSNELMNYESWCNVRKENCPQFHYWATVLSLELTTLVFVRSLREANFNMYVDALTELTPWFFALDHTNYSRWIPVHLRDMAELPSKHPEVYKEFSAGNFTAQKTKRVFSAIPMDQNHEQNNAHIKDDGGAVGLTSDPNALRRWMVCGPEVARAVVEFEDGNLQMHNENDTSHHEQTPSVQRSFLKDVQSLLASFEDFGNPFEEDSQDLLVLDTKEIADPAVVETVRTAKEVGQRQFDTFVNECLLDHSREIDDTIHRNKLPLFNSVTRKPPKGKQQVTSLKKEAELFSRLYISCQTRDGNLEEFFRHENQACPPALSESEKLHTGTKSDLLLCLEGCAKSQSESPPATAIVLDGAAITQMLKPGDTKTFDEYAHRIFIPYIMRQLQNSTRLDLVWDSYRADSLKTSTREKRGKGVRRRVVQSGTMPGNWQSFLRVDENKVELFSFLSKVLVESFNEKDKELVVTDGEAVLRVPEQDNINLLAPCSHEEADTRMMVHVAHAAQHGHHKILVRTVDTDVVVLAVMVAQTLPDEDELWVAFGTGKSFRYLPVHEISLSLGPDKSRALPIFHALTGCDTVSAFVGHGKKSAWATWNALPGLTDALLTLSNAPSTVPETSLQAIERFVILLYDRTSNATDVNKARRKLFPKKNSVQRIPPTKAALEQHVKRAVYQGGHVWGQAMDPRPALPTPTDWGWRKMEDGSYQPHWTSLPEAAKSCEELVSCGCKKGCKKRCRCKKANLPCTGLCSCDGECL